MVSKYQKSKTEKRKVEAVKLYKQGLSLRKVAAVVNRSHQWVATVVRELDKTLH